MSRRSTTSRSRSVSSRKSVGGKSKSSPRSPSSPFEDDETDSVLSTSQSEQHQKKKVVKKMNYTDDKGEEGLYTGYINSQCKPHGSGKMVYTNGKRFSGEWCEGTKVHGKTSDEKSKRRDKNRESSKGSSKYASSNGSVKSSKNASSNGSVKTATEKDVTTTEKQKHEQKQHALKEYKELYNNAAQISKNMLFVDFYGDRGRYTGEVNEQMMPHGMGEITYDHGLVQEGKWVSTYTVIQAIHLLYSFPLLFKFYPYTLLLDTWSA